MILALMPTTECRYYGGVLHSQLSQHGLGPDPVFYLRRGGRRAFGNSSGSFNLAKRFCAAKALLVILSSTLSFSVGGLTLHPSSRKYCVILNRISLPKRSNRT